MSTSKVHRRRIMRADAVDASSASLLVDVPVALHGEGVASMHDLLDQARQEGRDEGYAAAMAELAAAEAAGRAAQLRRIADAVAAAAEQVGQARRELVELGAGEAAELAWQLAESVLQRELAVGRPVLDAVTRALQLVPEDEDLIIRLHPDDTIDAAELAVMVPEATVRVVADPKVEPGGCVIVAGPCRIDAQIGPAMERARAVLAELYPQPDSDDEGDTSTDRNGRRAGLSPLNASLVAGTSATGAAALIQEVAAHGAGPRGIRGAVA